MLDLRDANSESQIVTEVKFLGRGNLRKKSFDQPVRHPTSVPPFDAPCATAAASPTSIRLLLNPSACRGQIPFEAQALLTGANACWASSCLGMFPSHVFVYQSREPSPEPLLLNRYPLLSGNASIWSIVPILLPPTAIHL